MYIIINSKNNIVEYIQIYRWRFIMFYSFISNTEIVKNVIYIVLGTISANRSV